MSHFDSFLSKHLSVVQLMGLVVQKLGLSDGAISDKIAAEASHKVLKFLKWNHDRGWRKALVKYGQFQCDQILFNPLPLPRLRLFMSVILPSTNDSFIIYCDGL